MINRYLGDTATFIPDVGGTVRDAQWLGPGAAAHAFTAIIDDGHVPVVAVRLYSLFRNHSASFSFMMHASAIRRYIDERFCGRMTRATRNAFSNWPPQDKRQRVRLCRWRVHARPACSCIDCRRLKKMQSLSEQRLLPTCILSSLFSFPYTNRIGWKADESLGLMVAVLCTAL